MTSYYKYIKRISTIFEEIRGKLGNPNFHKPVVIDHERNMTTRGTFLEMTTRGTLPLHWYFTKKNIQKLTEYSGTS